MKTFLKISIVVLGIVIFIILYSFFIEYIIYNKNYIYHRVIYKHLTSNIDFPVFGSLVCFGIFQIYIIRAVSEQEIALTLISNKDHNRIKTKLVSYASLIQDICIFSYLKSLIFVIIFLLCYIPFTFSNIMYFIAYNIHLYLPNTFFVHLILFSVNFFIMYLFNIIPFLLFIKTGTNSVIKQLENETP